MTPETKPIEGERSDEDMVTEKKPWITAENQTKDGYSDVQTQVVNRRLNNTKWGPPRNRMMDRSARDKGDTNIKALRKRTLANGLDEAANTVLDDVKDQIRQAKKMFDDASNLFAQKLGHEAKLLYERFQEKSARGIVIFVSLFRRLCCTFAHNVVLSIHTLTLINDRKGQISTCQYSRSIVTYSISAFHLALQRVSLLRVVVPFFAELLLSPSYMGLNNA